MGVNRHLASGHENYYYYYYYYYRFYGLYTLHPTVTFFGSQCAGQSALSDTRSYELEDFVGAKFYFPHALAGGTLLCDLSLIINHTRYK